MKATCRLASATFDPRPMCEASRVGRGVSGCHRFLMGSKTSLLTRVGSEARHFAVAHKGRHSPIKAVVGSYARTEEGSMRRRDFITLIGGAVAGWPFAVRAQQPVLPEVGLLNSGSPKAFEDRLRAFREGLKESEYLEGDNVIVVYRWSEGQNDRLPAMAKDLIGRRVAVIAALGEAATYAAKAATSTIPIIFNVDDDPVKLGLVINMARPNGNLTGTNFFVAELTAKRLSAASTNCFAFGRARQSDLPREQVDSERCDGRGAGNGISNSGFRG